jgi:hypothetical protein
MCAQVASDSKRLFKIAKALQPHELSEHEKEQYDSTPSGSVPHQLGIPIGARALRVRRSRL